MTYPVDVTPEFFYSGLKLQDYLEGMTKNREVFEANYSNFTLNEDELSALATIKGTRHILVLTEDWCRFGSAIRPRWLVWPRPRSSGRSASFIAMRTSILQAAG